MVLMVDKLIHLPMHLPPKYTIACIHLLNVLVKQRLLNNKVQSKKESWKIYTENY